MRTRPRKGLRGSVWVLLARTPVRAGVSVRLFAPDDEPTVDGEIRREVGT